jgi:hypothetical protein
MGPVSLFDLTRGDRLGHFQKIVELGVPFLVWRLTANEATAENQIARIAFLRGQLLE